MHKAIIAPVFSLAFLVSAYAEEQTWTGNIISIDDAAKTFVCEWKDNSWTYRTTDKTGYRVGGKDGAFSDLKVGVRVNIGYDTDDKGRVAKWVNIEPRAN